MSTILVMIPVTPPHHIYLEIIVIIVDPFQAMQMIPVMLLIV